MTFKLYSWYNHRRTQKGKRLAYKNDAEYRRIEDLRHDGGRTSIIMLSEKLGLGMDEWKYQMNLEQKYAPDNTIHKILYFIDEHKLYSPKMLWRDYITWPRQRIKRGYNDRDVWSLYSHLANVISDSVADLRGILHGWPGEPMSFEEWQEILDKISDGFAGVRRRNNLYKLDSEEERDAAEKKIKEELDEAFILFHKWFLNLWD